MSASDFQDGISDAEVMALEKLWRATAAAPAESFLNQCVTRSRAELAADRQRRASVRFYLTAAAVLLVGWHVSLLAASSMISRANGEGVASPTQFADDRRVLLAELTAELAGDHAPERSAPDAPHGDKTRQ